MMERTLPPRARLGFGHVHFTGIRAEDGLIPQFRTPSPGPSPGSGCPHVLGCSRHGLLHGNPAPVDHQWENSSGSGRPTAAGIGPLHWKEKALCPSAENTSMMVHVGQNRENRDGWTRSRAQALAGHKQSSRTAHSTYQPTPPKTCPRQERRGGVA